MSDREKRESDSAELEDETRRVHADTLAPAREVLGKVDALLESYLAAHETEEDSSIRHLRDLTNKALAAPSVSECPPVCDLCGLTALDCRRAAQISRGVPTAALRFCTASAMTQALAAPNVPPGFQIATLPQPSDPDLTPVTPTAVTLREGKAYRKGDEEK